MTRPDLETVLRHMEATGRLKQLHLFAISEQGRKGFQASLQRPNGSTVFGVAIRETAVDALIAVLGPDHGQSWDDHLVQRKPARAPDADAESDYGDLI